MKHPARFGLLLLALLLSSCGRVKVISPLSDPDKSTPDQRLCGMWKPAEKGDNASDVVFLFIGKVGREGIPAGIMKAIMIGIDKRNNIEDMSLYFFTTSAGDNSYANLFFGEDVFNPDNSPAWNKKNIRSFLLYKYKVDDNKLTIWDIAENRVEDAVQKGRVKGKIERKGNPKTTVVTLTDGEDLLRFLKNGGDNEVFDHKPGSVYFRVK